MNRSFFSLIFVIFIDAIGIGIVLPIISSIFIDNSIFSITNKDFVVGLIISLYPLGMFLGSSILGSLSDNYGRKKVLLLSIIFNLLGIVCFILGISHRSLFLLISGRLISGLFAGNIPIAQAAVIDMSSKKNLNTRLAILTLSNSLGFSFGPLLGGACIELTNNCVIGSNISLLVLCSLLLISIFSILSFYKDTRDLKRKTEISLVYNINLIIKSMKSTELRGASIVMFLFILGYFGFFQYIPIYMKENFNLASDFGGYMLSVFAISYTFSLSVLFPLINKYLSAKKILVFSLITQLIFIMLFTTTNNIQTTWLLMIPIGIITPLAYISLIVIFSELSNQNNRGETMGIASALTALGWGISPIITGLLDGVNTSLPLYGFLIVLLATNLVNLKNYLKKSSAKKL